VLAILFRIVLYLVGILLDKYSYGYTDIDYKIFSDGARYIT